MLHDLQRFDAMQHDMQRCTSRSMFTLRGEPMTLPPVNRRAAGGDVLEQAGPELDATASAVWDDLANRMMRSAPLKVTALGMSSTMGCGALDPRVACEPAASWIRRTHDFLTRSLCSNQSLFRSTTLHTRVWAKNAVGPAWFKRCTSTMVAKDTDLLLLELFQPVDVAGMGGWEDINQSLSSVRAAAPASLVVLVYLPSSPKRLLHREGARERPKRLNRLSELAGEHGAALVAMDRLTEQLGREKLYSKKGTDGHPNALGHTQLGAFVAGFVVTRSHQPPHGRLQQLRSPHKLRATGTSPTRDATLRFARGADP